MKASTTYRLMAGLCWVGSLFAWAIMDRPAQAVMTVVAAILLVGAEVATIREIIQKP